MCTAAGAGVGAELDPPTANVLDESSTKHGRDSPHHLSSLVETRYGLPMTPAGSNDNMRTLVVVDGVGHRVRTRDAATWLLMCGVAIDPWDIDMTVPARDCLNPCRTCAKSPSRPPAPRKPTGTPRRPSTVCQSCGGRGSKARGGYCATCAERWLPVCTKCKGQFVPIASQRNSRKCPKCNGKPARRSVWSVAQAGSPGLGKRA